MKARALLPPALLRLPFDGAPDRERFERGADWVAATFEWLAEHREDLVAKGLMVPERTYACDACRDTGFRVVRERPRPAYARCNHAGRGGEERPRLGFAARVRSSEWCDWPPDLRERALELAPGGPALLLAGEAYLLDAAALRVAEELHGRSGPARGFDAATAPESWGIPWEAWTTTARVVVAGPVDRRLRAPQVEAVTSLCSAARDRILVLYGEDPADLAKEGGDRGARWGALGRVLEEREVWTVRVAGARDRTKI